MLAERRWEAGRDGAAARSRSRVRRRGQARAGRSPGGVPAPSLRAPPRGPVIDGRRDRRQVPATSGAGRVPERDLRAGPGRSRRPSSTRCLTRPRAGDSQVGPHLGAGDRVRPLCRARRPELAPSTSPSQPARMSHRRVPAAACSATSGAPPAPHPPPGSSRSAWPSLPFGRGPLGRERGAACDHLESGQRRGAAPGGSFVMGPERGPPGR